MKQAEKICPPNCVNDFLHVLDAMTDATIQNYVEEVLNFQLPDDLDKKIQKFIIFMELQSMNYLQKNQLSLYLSTIKIVL